MLNANILTAGIAGIIGFTIARNYNEDNEPLTGGGKLKFHFDEVGNNTDYQFWLDFIHNEKISKERLEDYISTKLSGQIPDAFPFKKGNRINWDVGLVALDNMFTLRPHSCALVYASPVLADRKKIEMLMGIFSDPSIPINVHMGIQRTFSYAYQNLQGIEGYPIHRNISIMLHAFAGNTGSDTKQYVISRPVTEMTKMLVNVFGDKVLIGTDMWHAKEKYQGWSNVRGGRMTDSQKKELQHIADEISRHRFFPIREIIYPTPKLQVYNKDRSLVFEHDYLTNECIINNERIQNSSRRFRWLINRAYDQHLTFNRQGDPEYPLSHLWIEHLPMIAIDITVLAEYYEKHKNE